MPIKTLLSHMTVTLSVSACLIVAAPVRASAAEANSGAVVQNQQPAPAPINWMRWSAGRARPYQPGVTWAPVRDKGCQLRSADNRQCSKWR